MLMFFASLSAIIFLLCVDVLMIIGTSCLVSLISNGVKRG